MSKCVECGKKLGFFKGYCHPTLGKKYYVCGYCFDNVTESVEKYREFISPYVGFFNIEPSHDNFKFNNISEQFTHTLMTYDGV
ncbi:MAG: hypothetical protein JSV67_06710 [Thermoplasmatales archaeon]|nr:MAG: hypothetical protein JSV67_06710 [Thermoplasmatales archaeon]